MVCLSWQARSFNCVYAPGTPGSIPGGGKHIFVCLTSLKTAISVSDSADDKSKDVSSTNPRVGERLGKRSFSTFELYVSYLIYT